jgi:hypothetical protein
MQLKLNISLKRVDDDSQEGGRAFIFLNNILVIELDFIKRK